MRSALVISCVCLVCCVGLSSAATILIRADGTGDYSTIQAGIFASSDGDTVLLADGTYTGSGNRDISFGGRTITLRSKSGNPEACVIDCEGTIYSNHYGIRLRNGEGPGTRIEGITIRRGFLWGISYPSGQGAALLCRGAHVTVKNCIFRENTARVGGGAVDLFNATAGFEDCRIIGNSTQGIGGGVNVYDTKSSFIGCQFSGNQSEGGGAIAADGGSTTLTRCTIAGNGVGAGGLGGGGILGARCDFLLAQSIVWGNCAAVGAQIYLGYYAPISMTISCCCLPEGGIYGEIWVQYEGRQVRQDPLFCGAVSCEDAPTIQGDYTLFSNSPALSSPSKLCQGPLGAFGIGCSPPTPLFSGMRSDAGPDGGERPLRLVMTANPVSSAAISYAIEMMQAGSVDLTIHDGSGRLVGERTHSALAAGRHTLMWRMDRDLARGVYFLRARSRSAEASTRFVWNP